MPDMKSMVIFRGCICALSAIATAFATPLAPIDFSYCGYGNANTPPPAATEIPARATLAPSGADDTAAIQRALDDAGMLDADSDGFRGAVLLRSGTYKIGGTLKLRASGVVLRGDAAVTLLATGIERRAVIVAGGAADRAPIGNPVDVGALPVPAGALSLELASVDEFAVGDRIIVRRPCNKAWISALGMDQAKGNFADRANWAQGSRELAWDRTIVSVDRDARRVSLDAPLALALEERFGGATVQKYEWPGRINRVGVENITIVSETDSTNPKDEEHAWFGVMIENVEDAWVRGVVTRGLASAGVVIGPGARAVTVEDCRVEAPVAEIGGWRRLGIWNNGQLVLVKNCVVEQSWHGLATGLCAAGPNVFFDCTAVDARADVTPFESLSAGTLYDNVRVGGAGVGFTFGNLGFHESHGAGWNAANCVLWNCGAERVRVENPPGAANVETRSAAVRSLWREQRRKRLEANETRKPGARVSSPAPDARAGLAACAPGPDASRKAPFFTIRDGRLLVDGRAVFGSGATSPWWKGDMIPARDLSRVIGASPTLWAPGRAGIVSPAADVARHVAASGAGIYFYWPGLWQDRRREAHDLTRRETPDVCAPFYEMPWARSGTGCASEGLSQYDLGKFNPWYWARLSESAGAFAAQGVFFLHHFHNVHNLLETGAHWADFPWRPGNCIQNLDMPDTGADGRARFANEFFDVTHPRRRELHRLHIRKGLDALKGHPNVIHTLAFQYVGPIAFQQFFLDTVAEWEGETGRDARVALITGKEQTDAILADPARAACIDVIDLSYWRHLADGRVFAPETGKNKAFRDLCREAFRGGVVPPTSEAQLYMQVREYRDRFPEKAIVCPPAAGGGMIPVLMAGGASLAPAGLLGREGDLPGKGRDAALGELVRNFLLPHLHKMKPLDGVSDAWCLGAQGEAALFYSREGGEIVINKPQFIEGCVQGVWFDPKRGITQAAKLDGGATIKKPGGGAWLLFVWK